MGKIYCIMGKSASGKDSIYHRLCNECKDVDRIVLYTTRPLRDGESDGREYLFVNEPELDDFDKKGRLIEKRTYNTVYGPWSYATVDDGRISLENKNYILIGTLESYMRILEYFGKENVRAVYIEVDAGTRLQRAIDREKVQKNPKYAELCRRFLADEEDFSEENLANAGIDKRYINEDIEICLAEIRKDMEQG